MSIIYINPFQFAAAPVGPTDPDFANVSLLLHGDGTNGSTTIVDNSPSPKTVTAYGNAQISTAQSKFGGASIKFDGSGDYLLLGGQTDFAFGLHDFTIECFYFSLGAGGGNFGTIIDSRSTSSIAGRFTFYHGGTMSLTFQSQAGAVATSALNTQQWYHLAVCRSSGVTRLFLNGVQAGSMTDNTDYTIGTNRPIIGSNVFAGAGLNGYIDDLRITKGVARYTSNFTPPTAPFPNA